MLFLSCICRHFCVVLINIMFLFQKRFSQMSGSIIYIYMYLLRELYICRTRLWTIVHSANSVSQVFVNRMNERSLHIIRRHNALLCCISLFHKPYRTPKNRSSTCATMTQSDNDERRLGS